MSGLLKGVGYFFRGMTMLIQPGLRRFVIIPLLANIAVFALIAGSLYQLMSGFYIDITGEIHVDAEFSHVDRHSDHLVGRDVTLRLPIYFYCVVFDLSFSRITR